MSTSGRFVQFIKRYIIHILLLSIVFTSIALCYLQNLESGSNHMKPEYHFFFIGQNSVDPFWKEVQRGVSDAAEELNVVAEFCAPRFNNPEEELRYLDMAITANVDGIITHVSSDTRSIELINQAYNKGIPVVTVENDSHNSNRSTFVGTNSFVLGKEAARLMIDATGGSATIAIIVSGDYELDSTSHNIKINGFLNAVKGYPEMKVVEVYTSKMGTLSAEEITQAIILNKPEIDAILTFNSMDTLGAAQAIVSHNKVGQITVIGYGDIESILHYIKMGIIYGTVMSDPYIMGYESLKALVDLKKMNTASTFIDTGVKVTTRDHLEEYEIKTHTQ
ncbi:MAG: sugar-binding protein [Dethiobacteria bacterium]|jgi:ribose transport system substrate-binding protein